LEVGRILNDKELVVYTGHFGGVSTNYFEERTRLKYCNSFQSE